MVSSILTLQDLYNESLVRELLEKTKACGMSWNFLGGTQFQATQVDTSVTPNITWDFFITQTQVGNTTFKYSLDIKKNAVAYISLADGPLPYTSRDSVVKDLYNVVEILVLNMDQKVKETIQFVQNITDCSS